MKKFFFDKIIIQSSANSIKFFLFFLYLVLILDSVIKIKISLFKNDLFFKNFCMLSIIKVVFFSLNLILALCVPINLEIMKKYSDIYLFLLKTATLLFFFEIDFEYFIDFSEKIPLIHEGFKFFFHRLCFLIMSKRNCNSNNFKMVNCVIFYSENCAILLI